MKNWDSLSTTQKLRLIDPLRADTVDREGMERTIKQGSWSILSPIYYAAPANDMFAYHDYVGLASAEKDKVEKTKEQLEMEEEFGVVLSEADKRNVWIENTGLYVSWYDIHLQAQRDAAVPSVSERALESREL
jgi:hypothetical protein